ncbi:MAG TPA: DUF1684 domain-containing protein [Nocardioides sp.]|nr:DUF1684 domain-containing protein [Nocardioides sp.]
MEAADPTPWDVETGTDGVVPFVRLGVVALPGLGELDVWGDGGRLVLDLDFAYAPSCAYDPALACLLAPPGNRVDAVVPVGELQP